MRTNLKLTAALVLLTGMAYARAKKPVPPTPVEEYVAAMKASSEATPPSPGSLYSTGMRFSDLSRDIRASQPGDLVTILVSDRASAVSTGATSSSRKSSAKASIPALAGPRTAIPALDQVLDLQGESKLDGAGATSRSNTLNATLTARVVDVMPNGNLIVEGIKDVQANSEKQRITVRGVIRWNDLSPQNIVRSDRIGQMQIEINGKGVVGDAIRRPNILYRILLGILPF